MTKEILDKLKAAMIKEIEIEASPPHITGFEQAAKAALSIFEEYVVFLGKGAELLAGDELDYGAVVVADGDCYEDHDDAMESKRVSADIAEKYGYELEKRNGKPVVILGE